ncbi:MAG TPA: SulP family inorganic anion transporter, partial [Hanamia sp.]|nr:SulP family inorganic anion transporter [Hanamia sp.]
IFITIKMEKIFRPKLIDTLKTYTRKQFTNDLFAGIIVGVVALPLAIAFAIASGVTPEKGLITAVVAGFIISALGGSRVQIGGPTGAFIVIVYGIVQTYGVNGLIIATFMAGIMLIIMGFAKLGTVIKFIPHPLIIGFTSGIALIIFSSQVKDFLGLSMGAVPADFLAKWKAFFLNISSINIYAVAIAAATILIILLWPKVNKKIPGSLIAILVATAVVQFFHLPVETIGSRFGVISSSFPAPQLPLADFATFKKLIQPAFTIAMLGAIESLLSAVVADGMISGNHRSNTELIAQGTANIFSSLFGGIPATGAIARTATNVKNGGRTPVAGIVHAVTLLIILLIAGSLASLIPIANLAGILVIVAYNMSEWKNFKSILKGPKGDVLVLLITFFLTVLIDLTVAIEVGMILAAFLFMRNMIKFSGVSAYTADIDDEDFGYDLVEDKYQVPKGVEVFEIMGPLFFGAAYKFKDAMKYIEHPKALIIRMRHVPLIDATGIQALKYVSKDLKKHHTKLILSEVNSKQVLKELKDSRLLFSIGKGNIFETLEQALQKARQEVQAVIA